jgi:glucose-6-phosphate 1-dehydrogenase
LNYVHFRLSPDVTIAIGARVKQPKEQMLTEPTELKAINQQPGGDEVEAYERLLGNAIVGDTTVYARQDSVDAAWSIVQPVLEPSTPLHEYDPGTWGSAEAAELAANVGGWHCPVCAEPTAR